MIGCEKIRKYLSQIREAKVTVENLTDALGDANFELTRDELSSVCEGVLARFKALILAAVANAGLQISDVSRLANVCSL